MTPERRVLLRLRAALGVRVVLVRRRHASDRWLVAEMVLPRYGMLGEVYARSATRHGAVVDASAMLRGEK